MTGNIQFSYPMMSGSMSNGEFTITHDGGGYFQYNYTKNNSDVYKLFKPTKISFFSNSMTIEHKYNSNTLYVKYNTIQNNSDTFVTTADNIYLNKSIGDGIVITEKVKFKDKTCNLSSKADNFYIDMSSIGTIPLSYTFDDSTSDTFPTTDLSSIIDISLSPSSFISDEMVCDEGTNNSTITSDPLQDNLSQQQSYFFQGFGWLMFSMLIQFMILNATKDNITKFATKTSILGFDNKFFSHNLYAFLTFSAFVCSLAFFIMYGVWGPTSDKTIKQNNNSMKSYWYYLVLAVVFLFSFILLLWWKVVYLTDP